MEEAELTRVEKYNTNNDFSMQNSENESTELIPYEKESIWQKIKNKFMRIFQKTLVLVNNNRKSRGEVEE